MIKRKKLFFDMDGTLFMWKELELDKLYLLETAGYFSAAKPYEDMAETVRTLAASGKYDMYILSVAWGDDAVRGKDEALDRVFGKAVFSRANRMFVPQNTSKAEYAVKRLRRNLNEDFLLFDDHTANLYDWAKNGGTGVKVLNGINNRGGSQRPWKGVKMTMDGHMIMPDPPDEGLLGSWDCSELLEALYADAVKRVMDPRTGDKERAFNIEFLKTDQYGFGTEKIQKVLGIA